MIVCASIGLALVAGLIPQTLRPTKGNDATRRFIQGEGSNGKDERPSRQSKQWAREAIREECTAQFTRIVLKGMLGDKGYKYSVLPTPPRLVVDLLEPKREPAVDRVALNGGAFQRVRIGRHPDKIRFVLDVRKGGLPEPSVFKRGEDLVIQVRTPPETTEALASVREPVTPVESPLQSVPRESEWQEGGIREAHTAECTRILFQGMLGARGYKYSILPNPSRLVVDVLEPKWEPSVDRVSLKGEAFSRLRVGRYPDKIRFVLDCRRDDLPDPRVEKQGADLVVLADTPGEACYRARTSENAHEESLEAQKGKRLGLTAAEFRGIVSSYSGRLRGLYEKELQKDPTLQGTVTVMLEIDSSGRVTETVLVSSTIGSESLVNALLDAVLRWEFPEASADAGKTRITYPFVFGPPRL
jgi:TonB family protein